ncbi:hypothetical protein CMQ_3376 [Grosmannia clavigera kw1407]|uniref:Uncharacterized protein n=1 Tax=Grosmannia clavigera (strain kw1407 / UAMH 11150) TaxID=655863 RepID=F0X9J2_GROCL|nr:uncharacterized protein CMQ_3376 [Grosmannia clavigera kw1407]EFX05307.1 hypothetical protein CMQ_3376 [Grosmannia clavigera kw1407]
MAAAAEAVGSKSGTFTLATSVTPTPAPRARLPSGTAHADADDLADDLAADFSDLDLEDSSPITLGLSDAGTDSINELEQTSSLTGEIARMVPAVKDEQIVNMALILFLDALAIHCEDVNGGWSAHRHPFVFKDKDRTKIYEARVDGCLTN